MRLYLKKDPFDSILSGNKTLEIRKYCKFISNNINNNSILFINKDRVIKVNVISIKIYAQYDEMISNIDILLVRKNISKDKYTDILKKCYKNFKGKWVSINFKYI
tara:strand:- start:885 stop:1199 length:315 start_codon:yes stop_codon:yes gene_type:complete